MKKCKYGDEEVECRCPEKEISDDHCFLCLTASTLTEFDHLLSHLGNAEIPLAHAASIYQHVRNITINLDCLARFRGQLVKNSPKLQELEKRRLKLAKRFGEKNEQSYRM